MKKTYAGLAAIICLSGIFSCSKPNNSGSPSVTGSPFLDTLRKYCTAPFVGLNDSSSCKVYLPTAFTPNGDGIDDVYGIISCENTFRSFALAIYDTTGALTFYSNSPSYKWFGVDTVTGKRSTKYKFFVTVNYTTEGGITDSGKTFLYLLASDSAKGCVERVYADTAKYEFGGQFLPYSGFVGGNSNEIFCN